MKFVKAEEKHVEEALKLAIGEYENECRQIKQLPVIDVADQLRNLIAGLFCNNYGVVAICEGEMVGYLAFTEPIKGFFGTYGLVKHMSGSPVFYPTDISQFMKKLSKEQSRIFAAIKEEEVIGYLSIQDEGETFISETDSMKNICGAFVKEEYRGTHVADDLLAYVCNVCKKDGISYLGVDCETLNPNALRFWGKHFKNYTYSYHRRIDERIAGYESYLRKEWISHL